MKNKIIKNKDHIFRVLEVKDNQYLIVDCRKLRMAKWIPEDDVKDYVVRTILTRRISEYEANPEFDYYYDDILKLINEADYVFGHSLNGDARALNCDCQRYGLPSIDFKFYDIKEFYKQYNSSKNDTSVVNILNDLEIEGEEGGTRC